MCWIPTNKEHGAIAKVAQKDIPIIKIGSRVSTVFVSGVFAALYDMNKPTLREFICPDIDGSVRKGFHFYKPNMVTLSYTPSNHYYPGCDTYRWVKVTSRLGKKHRIKTLSSYYYNWNTAYVAKGYVPKGTMYYLNAHGEGVAEQIVITEIKRVKDYLTNKKLSKL